MPPPTGIAADPCLSDLVWHWGSAYAIGHPAPDTWFAQRRDGRGMLRAATPDELLSMIRSDYQVTPVPR